MFVLLASELSLLDFTLLEAVVKRAPCLVSGVPAVALGNFKKVDGEQFPYDRSINL